jgi:bacillithiol biosynthesis deacetylase BshB1
MADGFFENDEVNKRRVIQALRKFKPEIVLCNAPEDRHPDHGRSSKLVSDACFLSGLRKIETMDNGVVQQAWRPKYVFYYLQDRFLQPDFVMDISDHMEKKIASVLSYSTQFYNPDLNEPQTYISSPEFLETVRARAMMLGKRIGVKFAEGYISEKMIGIKSFDAIIQQST